MERGGGAEVTLAMQHDICKQNSKVTITLMCHTHILVSTLTRLYSRYFSAVVRYSSGFKIIRRQAGGGGGGGGVREQEGSSHY